MVARSGRPIRALATWIQKPRLPSNVCKRHRRAIVGRSRAAFLAVLGLAKGIDVQQSIAPYLDTAFIPVSPERGRFLKRDSGFESVTVPIGEGMEFSVYRGS
jgi:hypothetical protein